MSETEARARLTTSHGGGGGVLEFKRVDAGKGWACVQMAPFFAGNKSLSIEDIRAIARAMNDVADHIEKGEGVAFFDVKDYAA